MNSRERQLNAFERSANIIYFSNIARKEFLALLTFLELHSNFNKLFCTTN